MYHVILYRVYIVCVVEQEQEEEEEERRGGVCFKKEDPTNDGGGKTIKYLRIAQFFVLKIRISIEKIIFL